MYFFLYSLSLSSSQLTSSPALSSASRLSFSLVLKKKKKRFLGGAQQKSLQCTSLWGRAQPPPPLPLFKTDLYATSPSSSDHSASCSRSCCCDLSQSRYRFSSLSSQWSCRQKIFLSFFVHASKKKIFFSTYNEGVSECANRKKKGGVEV